MRRSFQDAYQYARHALGYEIEGALRYAITEHQLAANEERIAAIRSQRPSVDDSPTESAYSVRNPDPTTYEYLSPALGPSGYRRSRMEKATLITRSQGQDYRISLHNPGKGQPFSIDWLGKADKNLDAHKPRIPIEKIVGLVKKKGADFVPLSSPATSADERKRIKMGGLGAPIEELKKFEKEMVEKRVRSFEHILGGKAKDLGLAKWRIGPILALLASIGLVGSDLWNKYKSKHDEVGDEGYA